MKSGSKKTAEINLWNEEEPQEQQQFGCGICGLTAQELSTIDPETGDSLVGTLSLALPCDDCLGEYQEHATCDMCSGDGSISCDNCYGEGDIECDYCNRGEVECNFCDEGKKECYECSGEGVIEDDEGEEEECSYCDGTGVADCDDCDGTGVVECIECGGRGSEECGECWGNGSSDCPDCEGYGYTNCETCNDDGIKEWVTLEEWCAHWEYEDDYGGIDNPALYHWRGPYRENIVWTDHCLAYGPDPQTVAPTNLTVINQPPAQPPTDQQGFNLAKVGFNKEVWAYKNANADLWGEEDNADQLRLVGCPNCGSDDLMAHFEDGAIFVSCEECGNYFNYEESYDLSGKKVPGYPTVVEDTLTNGEIYQGPTDSVDFEYAIENLVSGRNNEFFDDEAADQLYAWANILQALPELKEGAEKVADDAREEIDNWTFDGIYQDPTYISVPTIEDMDDEEFVDAFGEDKTREEAMEESDEAFNWYWEENARNHGAYQAAKYLLDYLQQQPS